MRRALVCQHSAAFIRACHAVDNLAHAAGQAVNLIGLARNDVRQILNRAGQMRHAFL